jgi:hypothetical protein
VTPAPARTRTGWAFGHHPLLDLFDQSRLTFTHHIKRLTQIGRPTLADLAVGGLESGRGLNLLFSA